MAKDYKAMVSEQEERNQALYARMKEDNDLLNLRQYVMKDNQSPPRPVPGIVNITLNMPSYMATTILVTMSSATEQVVVEAQRQTFDTAYVEDFIKACMESSNEYNRRHGRKDRSMFTDGQLCMRGRAVRRVLFRRDGDMLVPDISFWDAAGVTREYGDNGLKWAAYHMKKSKDQILSQYGKEIAQEDADVLDVWDEEKNQVWIDGTLYKEEEHSYGFTPVIEEIVPIGSGGILLDAGNMASEGESIFFMIRGIVPELNRLASIMQTLNLLSVKQPVKDMTSAQTGGEPPDYEDAMSLGRITAADIQPIQFGDAQRSAQMAYQMMKEAFESGGASPAQLGMLGQNPPSGVALLVAGEGRNRIYNPRLGSKGRLNAATARMIIEQVRQQFGGGTVKVGYSGFEESYNVSKLEGSYNINYRYSIKSQEVDAGRATLAAAYGNLMSDHTKREDVIQMDDPDGEEDLIRAEEAERMSPMIKMYKSIKSLKRLDRDYEAELLALEYNMNLDRLLGGEVTEQKTETAEQPKQVVSLFGGGSGRVPGGEQNKEVR